jgi:hypothetical protein
MNVLTTENVSSAVATQIQSRVDRIDLLARSYADGSGEATLAQTCRNGAERP